MSLRGVFKAVSVVVLAGALAGCSSIVRKPEINGVKKVAIVSIYADEMVPWTAGQGRIENFDQHTRNRVALQAYKAFAHEFERLNWEPVSLNVVARDDYYRKNFGPQQVNKDSNMLAKAANVLGNLHNTRYFTPDGLFPIEWPKKNDDRAGASFNLANFKLEGKKDFKGQMADLAKSLDVDAVVIVGMDYCYTGATAVLGNGTAKITAGSWVKAINPDKEVVVDMPITQKRCDGDRGESTKTVAMVGGSITLGRTFAGDTLVTAFKEATDQSAHMTVDRIQKAIQN